MKGSYSKAVKKSSQRTMLYTPTVQKEKCWIKKVKSLGYPSTSTKPEKTNLKSLQS